MSPQALTLKTMTTTMLIKKESGQQSCLEDSEEHTAYGTMSLEKHEEAANGFGSSMSSSSSSIFSDNKAKLWPQVLAAVSSKLLPMKRKNAAFLSCMHLATLLCRSIFCTFKEAKKFY